MLESYYKNYDITLRGYTKIIKVARTIADLECCDEIMDYHIIESIGFRKKCIWRNYLRVVLKNERV